METDIWGDGLAEVQASLETGGHWLRFQDGDCKKLRLLGTLTDGNMIRGWLSFGLNSKPIYKLNREDISPEMLGIDPWGNPQKVWPFWCLPVWDHGAEKIQLWEIRQQTLQQRLFTLTSPAGRNTQWSDWRTYDLEVAYNRKLPPGQMWSCSPLPHAELSPETKTKVWECLSGINMAGLFEGQDPLDPVAQSNPSPSPFDATT